MDKNSMIFWNVDTQNDFVEPWGKLYVHGAELIKPVWAEITKLARLHHIQVVNTADYHYIYSAEIDPEPDMVNTFPPHCLAGTPGAEFIRETRPDDPVVFHWNVRYDYEALNTELSNSSNIVILKDAFDAFSGNSATSSIVELLKPQIVVVYGVTTNVCVDYAVRGLVERIPNVYVVKNAIKELPAIPFPFSAWDSMGVKLITMNELVDSFN